MSKVSTSGKYLELTAKEESIINNAELSIRLELLQLQANNTPEGAIMLSEKIASLQGADYFISKFTDNMELIAARVVAAKEGKNAAELKAITSDNLSAKNREKIAKFIAELI